MIVHTLTRRSFVRGALSVASLLRVSLVHATPPPLIPRAVLFDNPDVTSVRLHANAIAKNRTSRKRAGGIHGDNANRAP